MLYLCGNKTIFMNINIFVEANKHVCRSFGVQDIMRMLCKQNPFAVMAWGIKNIGILKKDEEEVGALIHVNGKAHKGPVLLTLNFMDYFDVRLMNDEGVVLKSQTDIFVGELLETMDSMIENPKVYN